MKGDNHADVKESVVAGVHAKDNIKANKDNNEQRFTVLSMG